MLSIFLVATAACLSSSLRPGYLVTGSHSDEVEEKECPQLLQPPPDTAKEPACFITKGGYNDGIGHQLFGTLSVMGMHGLMSDFGHCYVFDAAPREFAFHHLKNNSEAWEEGQHLMTKFYDGFRSKHRVSGCVTARLLNKSPGNRVPMCKNPLLLGEIPCHEDSTWELDNMWYGDSLSNYHSLKLKTTTPFMLSVIRNATALAKMAAEFLPKPKERPSLAVHMRFGDRRTVLKATLLGQLAFFKDSDANLAQFGPMRVFTDGHYDAKIALNHTAFEDADIQGPNDSTVLQAIAQMVAADVFVGSRSDVSSCAAMMRIALGKKHTFMPDRWAWVDAFSKGELASFPEVQEHK